MYGEHVDIKHKISVNQDYLTDEEELDEEDDPVQLNMDDTELMNKRRRKHLMKKQQCPLEKPEIWSGW